MALPVIGHVKCTTCEHDPAFVKETKRGFVMIYCDACGQQSFARTPKSDKAIRARMRAVAPAADPSKPIDPDARAPGKRSFLEDL